MRQPGGRSFAFISGFMIGMLSALGIVFLLMNDWDPVNFTYRNPFTKEPDTIVDRTGKLNFPLKKIKTEIEKSASVLIRDSISETSSDSTQIQESSDEAAGEMVIRRDEMISTLTIEAIRLTPKTKNDSLLRQLVEAPVSDFKKYKVEFWRSPVNFKGYRLIRNSLILFGLNPDVPVNLQQGNDYLILKYGNQNFKLIPTESFEPMPRPIVE